MKKGYLSSEQFSYKDDSLLKFTPNNYLLVIKDEEHPEKNVIPILYFDNDKISDVLEYEMDKIYAKNDNNNIDKRLSDFRNSHQILKIVRGNVRENYSHNENPNLPKCITLVTSIEPTQNDELIEIFNGDLDEPNSRIKISESLLESLILDVYIEENTPVFIEKNNLIYGPFKVLSQDNEGFFKVEKHFWKDFGSYQVKEDTYIEFNINEIDRKIHIPSVNHLELIEYLDFKDDHELKKQFIERLKKSPESFKTNEIEALLSDLHKLEQDKSISNYIKENDRIGVLLKNTTEKLISDKELATLIPEFKIIKNEIEKFKEELQKLESKIKQKTDSLEEIDFTIDKKQEKIEELENKKNDLDKFLNDESNKVIDKLKNEIEELENKKSNLETDIDNETQNRSKELNEINIKIKELKEAEQDLNYSVDKLKIENQETQRDSLKGLIELFKNKKYFDFFSGRDLSEFDKKEEKTYNDYTLQSHYDNYFDFRNELTTILEKNGRKFETHFIDNLLISIHQNTLTILAGLPGTGKTSLARLLTTILAPKDRVSEVSVSRGWTSQKDLIGFQNPLTNKFHSSPTGVYELLCQLDYEVHNNNYKNSPLAFTILDEANLSPIEHYWSIFYNLTDSYATENNYLSISLGNNSQISYANNLRFIATINYDQTTENLSPRIIDRANIIQIPELDNINFNNSDFKHLNISYQKCIEFFKLNDFEDIINDIDFKNNIVEEIYNKVKVIFKELKSPISPRVEIAIKRYCLVADDLMKKEPIKPLDYCIAQRLLPTINLQGDSSKRKLDELLRILEDNNLNNSKSILDKIIKNGSDDNIYEGNFNYFLSLTYA